MPVALRSSLVIIAIAAVALGVTGCRFSENPAASPSSVASPSVDATVGADGASAPGTGAVESPQPLDEPEAARLEAELNAIEKELDSMDLPSDSDFEDIEGALE